MKVAFLEPYVFRLNTAGVWFVSIHLHNPYLPRQSQNKLLAMLSNHDPSSLASLVANQILRNAPLYIFVS